MKRLLALLLCLSITSPSWGAFALISHTSAASVDGGATVTTSAIDTTGANLIVIGLSNYGSSPTLTDSKSNTWTNLTPHSYASFQSTIYYCYAPTVGSGHTFAFSSGVTYPTIHVLAFSGSASSPFDVQNGGTGDFNTTLQTGNVTPSVDNELIFTHLVYGAGAVGTPTINASFNALDNQPYTGAENVGGITAYKIQTTAGSENPTWTVATSAVIQASIATFKASAVVVSVPVNHVGLTINSGKMKISRGKMTIQ